MSRVGLTTVPEEPTLPTPSSEKVSAPVTYQRSASGSDQPAWLASAVNERISGGGPKRRRPQAASARAATAMRRRSSSEAVSEKHNHPVPAALPRPTHGRSGAAARQNRIGHLTEGCHTHIGTPTFKLPKSLIFVKRYRCSEVAHTSNGGWREVGRTPSNARLGPASPGRDTECACSLGRPSGPQHLPCSSWLAAVPSR